MDKNNALIIGGPNVGKTHFGGQLYGRLQERDGTYKIVSTPDDLKLFEEVLQALAEGKSAGRTQRAIHHDLSLEIEESKSGKQILFSFPDYGGEQVNEILNSRRINKTWGDKIQASDHWLLFIRLDEVAKTEDITTKMPDPEVLQKRNEETDLLKLSLAAFFIELLQMLLYAKGVGTRKQVSAPRLLVVLSCWDNITGVEPNTTPLSLLKERLPMFFQFVESTWEKGAFSVLGLSSLGQSLSNDQPNTTFIDQGPEGQGFIVTPDGTQEKDLTLIIQYLTQTTNEKH